MRREILFMFVVMPLAMLGCWHDAPQMPNANSTSKQDASETVTTIIPGVGTADIRIGMTVESLKKYREPSRTITFEDLENEYWLDYQDDGISVSCEGERGTGAVTAVHFFFLSKEYRPFRGQTKEGIGAQSSIREVICTYGQPEYAANTVAHGHPEWPGARTVTLAYAYKGIRFSFVNGKLAQITTSEVADDFDPPAELAGSRGDTGDTTEIRNIDCD